MRVTLTKHCGHGAKPLSHGNKEILSSFVRRCPYLRLASVLFLSRFSSPLSLSLSLSLCRARALLLFHLLLSTSVCHCSDYYAVVFIVRRPSRASTHRLPLTSLLFRTIGKNRGNPIGRRRQGWRYHPTSTNRRIDATGNGIQREY